MLYDVIIYNLHEQFIVFLQCEYVNYFMIKYIS